MPTFLIFLISIWLIGVGLCLGLHRIAKVKLPLWLPAVLSLASLCSIFLVGYTFITRFSPYGEMAMLASALLGCWFFLSAFHVWFYRVLNIAVGRPVYPWGVLQALLLFVLQGLAFVSIFDGILTWNERCNPERGTVMIFTGHLKNLCVEQKGSGQCPQNEEALQAFNPPLYKKLKHCARTSYWYDSNTERFQWTVRFSNQEMFADPENLPGIGIPPEEFQL